MRFLYMQLPLRLNRRLIWKTNTNQGPDKQCMMFKKLLLAEDKGYGMRGPQLLKDIIYSRHWRQYSASVRNRNGRVGRGQGGMKDAARRCLPWKIKINLGRFPSWQVVSACAHPGR